VFTSLSVMLLSPVMFQSHIQGVVPTVSGFIAPKLIVNWEGPDYLICES
jgi:hypothetical protein